MSPQIFSSTLSLKSIAVLALCIHYAMTTPLNPPGQNYTKSTTHISPVHTNVTTEQIGHADPRGSITKPEKHLGPYM